MKERLTKNLGIKLLSLVLAAIAWVVIMNLDDPMKVRQFSDIPVEVLNESEIQSLDKVYEIAEGATVNVTVRGRRSIIDSLKSTDLKATANLSNRYITDAQGDTLNVHIEAYCTRYTSNNVDVRITGDAQVLKISLEDISNRQFKVNVKENGTVADGYAVGSIIPKPNMIEVSGAKSQIARIAEVRIDVDVTGASQDFKVKLKPKVYDENGKEIDSSKMKFSSDEIVTNVKMVKTKTIPVYMKIMGTASFGYENLGMDYEPKQIEVASDSATLAKLKACTVPVDITGATADVEKSIDFSKYLPKNVRIIGDTQNVTIKVTIKKMITKEFRISPNNIQVKNIPDGMRFNYKNSNETIIVRIMGLEEDLASLSSDSLGAYIDLTDLKPGAQKVSIQFVLNDKVELAANPIIEIELTKSGGSVDENSPSPSPSVSPSPIADNNNNMEEQKQANE